MYTYLDHFFLYTSTTFQMDMTNKISEICDKNKVCPTVLKHLSKEFDFLQHAFGFNYKSLRVYY